MRSHKTRTNSTRDRSITQLAKVSFDEILDLTADVFSFYNKISRQIFATTCSQLFWDTQVGPLGCVHDSNMPLFVLFLFCYAWPFGGHPRLGGSGRSGSGCQMGPAGG